MTPRHELDAIEYARAPQVAARVREFCGFSPGQRSHCIYLAAMGSRGGPTITWGSAPRHAPAQLEDLLAAGDDIARSLWDSGQLLLYVDLDYARADDPGEAYLHPADTFLKLEPAYQGLCAELDRLGLPFLDLMTGAGYGFVGRIALSGKAAAGLSALAATPAWHATHAERRPDWVTRWIDEEQARAYQGLGLVLEHVAHRVLTRVAPESPIPLVVNNTEVGWGRGGRECISIDLSHMGDPLDSRFVRVPFGLYQKHRLRPDLVGDAASRMPPLAVVPRGRRPLLPLLADGRDLASAADAALETRTSIPDAEKGVRRLLDDYAHSGLARWHRDYYAGMPGSNGGPGDGVASLIPAGLPPCIAACLEYPNDLLLKPTHVQLLVRALLGQGWSARQIADLVRAHYSRPDLWGDHWRRVDPFTRADFEVRVFAGLVAMGLDQGIDFNCVSTQEKGVCTAGGCGIDLRDVRDRMLARIRT